MSTQRTFPNWLDAFLDFADDDFTPPQFNEWVGLSTIAGALERKVWLPWSDGHGFYPNLYILLVAMPGIGKSTAIMKGVELLREMDKAAHQIKFIPSQVTEAKFIELMAPQSSFTIGNTIHWQSAGYYFASEASNELKNVYGDFIACLTAFYDNPKIWEKATQKGGRTTLKEVTLNLIAGSTFDYLAKLVNDENIMGGFASRLIYVVCEDKKVRAQKFQGGIRSTEAKQARTDYKKELVADLRRIHNMKGMFTGDAEFAEAWEKWYVSYETKRMELSSEKLQALLTRTNTNLFKVAICLSAAESDDRVLKLHHFERARALVEPIAESVPRIFQTSKSLQTQTQSGLNNAIIRSVQSQLTEQQLMSKLLGQGFGARRATETIDKMLQVGDLKVISNDNVRGKVFEFVGDLHSYL